MLAVGVDGTRGGWLAVALEEGAFSTSGRHATLSSVLAAYPEATIVGIDMPIGLPTHGLRTVDGAMRKRLGRHASRVFSVYPVAVYEATSHVRAVQLCRELGISGISAQAYAIGPKILEVERERDARVIEVHPELSFAEMVGRVLPNKRSWNGIAQRTEALQTVGILLPSQLGDSGDVPASDVLDAAAAAWTATRRARGEARPVGMEAQGAITPWV